MAKLEHMVKKGQAKQLIINYRLYPSNEMCWIKWRKGKDALDVKTLFFK